MNFPDGRYKLYTPLPQWADLVPGTVYLVEACRCGRLDDWCGAYVVYSNKDDGIHALIEREYEIDMGKYFEPEHKKFNDALDALLKDDE